MDDGLKGRSANPLHGAGASGELLEWVHLQRTAPRPQEPALLASHDHGTVVLAEALGVSVAEVLALPDYLQVFCFELLTYGGPEAGQ